MPKHRRRFTPQQKAAILREHLIDKVAISDLCDKHGLQPTVFYRWQKELFDNLASLFERQNTSETTCLRRETEALRDKLAHKDEVIAEIMEDYVAVKKTVGER
jgi:transposase